MRFLSLIALCICVCSVSLHTVQAQNLNINTSVTGTITDQSEDSYLLVAREGQLLSLLAESDDELDAMVRIEDLNSNIIIQNDDYDYPDSRNAIIEGFVAPYTGSYTVIISAYGNTAGDYTLSMFSGYSEQVVDDSFDSGGSWTAVGTDLIDIPEFSVVNGTANLIQDGIDKIGIAVGVGIADDVYYARTTIDSITDNVGWRTGLVFGYQDQENFYRVVINFRGAWRIVRVRNGEEAVLRDWNVHPAIMPDTRSFSIAILVNDTSFDVFYDDQYIGSAVDSAFRNGQVGLVAESIDALGSTVTVRFDDLAITRPTFVNNQPIFPTQIIGTGTNSSIRELEQRLLIPTGGEMAFTLSESFAQNNREGVSRFAIGNGRTANNFALGTRISWVANSSDNNGCGIVFRDDGAENYVIAYVDSDGGFGLSERSGSEFIQNIYNTRIENMRPPYEMILVVRDDMVHYYLDGTHAGSMTIGTRDGVIAEAVINFEAVNTNCQFNNLWVWFW